MAPPCPPVTAGLLRLAVPAATIRPPSRLGGTMRRTTITALLAAAALALAGCSTSSGDGKPAVPSPSVTTSAPVKQSKTEQVAACTEAIVAGEGQDSPECSKLSTDDAFKALQAANKRGRDALESAIASASAAGR